MDSAVARIDTKCHSNQKTKTQHKGKKVDTKDIKDELVEWILMNWTLGIAITLWEVIFKTYKLDESLKIYKWLTENNLIQN